jgi:SAM-dependent methyltransferase
MKNPIVQAASAAEQLRGRLLDQPWFQSRLLPALPRQLRWFLRRAYLAPIDLVDRLTGRDQEMPPKAGNFSGDRALHDFGARGEFLVDALVKTAALTPSSHVLDIGCGPGRLAIAMSKFMDADGRYEGLDVVPEGIKWCEQHVASAHANVNFTLADVYNKEYNPQGRQQAADYRFPWDDETFDLAVLISVFTHMLPSDVDRYVSEIARVLKTNGRVVASYYIITPESLELMRSNGRGMQFGHNLGSRWIQNGRVPELAVGYDANYIQEVYTKHGLSWPSKIYLGGWCGRQGHWPRESVLGGQDTVVATKL